VNQERPYPKAIVSRKAAKALAGGHPWVFEGEVIRTEPADDGTPVSNGGVVDVFEENGTWQGTGLLSAQSKIRVRIVTHNSNDRVDEGFWRPEAHLGVGAPRDHHWAGAPYPAANRHQLLPRALLGGGRLTGLVVDRYEDVLVSQVGTVGMERLRPTIYPLLLDVLRDAGQDVAGIYERNDTPQP